MTTRTGVKSCEAGYQCSGRPCHPNVLKTTTHCAAGGASPRLACDGTSQYQVLAQHFIGFSLTDVCLRTVLVRRRAKPQLAVQPANACLSSRLQVETVNVGLASRM